MATTTASTAADTFPVNAPDSGAPGRVYGTAAVDANPSDGDVFELCKLPAGAVITGGRFIADAMETDGSPELAYSLGYTDDPLALGSDTFAQDTGFNVTLFGISDHPNLTALDSEKTVAVTFDTAALGFSAGSITVIIDYVMPITAG